MNSKLNLFSKATYISFKKNITSLFSNSAIVRQYSVWKAGTLLQVSLYVVGTRMLQLNSGSIGCQPLTICLGSSNNRPCHSYQPWVSDKLS